MAGWQIVVSWRALRASGESWVKMASLRLRPRMGAMMRSASAKVSATTGSSSLSVFSMLMYWEPWPGNMKAVFPAGPWPRWMPWAERAFHVAGSSLSMAVRAKRRRRLRWDSFSKAMLSRWGALLVIPGKGTPSSSCCRKPSASSAPRDKMPPVSDFSGWPWPVPGPVSARIVWCSESTAWKLEPPKPNDETPATRGPWDSQPCKRVGM